MDQEFEIGGAPLGSARQRLFVETSVFLCVYLIVLNTYVELWDRVVIDSFLISLLTAALLFVLLKATLFGEHRIRDYFSSRPGPGALVLRFFLAWLLLLGSKFVILGAVDIVFGDHVELGGLLPFILLSVALLAAEQTFRWVHTALA